MTAACSGLGVPRPDVFRPGVFRSSVFRSVSWPTSPGFLRKQLRVLSHGVPARELIVSFHFGRDRQDPPRDKKCVHDQPDLQPRHDFHVSSPFHVFVRIPLASRFGAIVCACAAKKCSKNRQRGPAIGPAIRLFHRGNGRWAARNPCGGRVFGMASRGAQNHRGAVIACAGIHRVGNPQIMESLSDLGQFV